MYGRHRARYPAVGWGAAALTVALTGTLTATTVNATPAPPASAAAPPATAAHPATVEASPHYPHSEGVPVQQEFAQKCGVGLSRWHNVAVEWTPDNESTR